MNAVHALNAVDGPAYVRTTRQKVPILTAPDAPFALGAWPQLRDGSDVTLVGCGPLVAESLAAAETLRAEGLHARVLNAHTVKPIDARSLERAASETGAIVTAGVIYVGGGLSGE